MIPDLDWLQAKALELIGGHSFLAIAISLEQVRELTGLGGQLAGVILVVPADAPDIAPDPEIATMTLRGPHSDIFTHVVCDFGPILAQAADRVLAFVDDCDPASDAIVVSVLPVPHALFKARQIWAQNDRISRSIEAKSAQPDLFDGVLSAIPMRARSWPCERKEWDSLVRSFGSSTLVVQNPGLSGGGSGTWVADCWERAIELVDSALNSVQIAPFEDGMSCNVNGFVAAVDRVLVFPPSMQLIDENPEGCPVYAGNVLGCGLFESTEIAEIRAEVKEFAARIAVLGFCGLFGLDFIRRPDGSRYYHDINPRRNGAIDSLEQLSASDGASPLSMLLLGQPDWSEAEINRLETNVDELVRDRCSWRFFLTKLLKNAWSGSMPPAAGRWYINPEVPTLTHVGPVCGIDELQESEALLLPVLAAGQNHKTGERLILGDMLCGQRLGSALTKLHGRQLVERLVDGFLG